jgi:hypothetical protein
MTATLVLSIVKLVYLILSEFFSWKKTKEKENSVYNLEMKDFRKMVEKSLNQLTQEAREDSAQAKDVEDQVDQEIKK